MKPHSLCSVEPDGKTEIEYIPAPDLREDNKRPCISTHSPAGKAANDDP